MATRRALCRVLRAVRQAVGPPGPPRADSPESSRRKNFDRRGVSAAGGDRKAVFVMNPEPATIPQQNAADVFRLVGEPFDSGVCESVTGACAGDREKTRQALYLRPPDPFVPPVHDFAFRRRFRASRVLEWGMAIASEGRVAGGTGRAAGIPSNLRVLRSDIIERRNTS